MGTVFNLQRYCTKDGHGIRTTVFLQGCPLHCPWCHNPEGMALAGCQSTELSARDLCQTLLQDKRYFDFSGGGVTFSGGEPLLQSDFVAECASLLKQNGIHIAVETCGNVPPSAVLPLLGRVDQVLFDIKHLDGPLLERVTGAKLSLVLSNLRLFDGADVPIILRVPLIDTFNLDETFFSRLGKLACDTKNVTRIELLPYHDLGEDKRTRLGMAKSSFPPLSQAQISAAKSAVQKYFTDVFVI